MSDLPFVVFHVTHANNVKEIRRTGLRPRGQLESKRRKFVDLADTTIKQNLGTERSFECLTVDGRWITRTIALAATVPFHYAKPLSRPDVGPTDVFVWQSAGHHLVACVIRKRALLKAPHFTSIGHWMASWYDLPLFLDGIRVFTKLFSAPEQMGTKLTGGSHYLESLIDTDLPNILKGKVKTAYLKPGSKYRSLLNSSLFVEQEVAAKDLCFVDYDDLGSLATDADYAFTCKSND